MGTLNEDKSTSFIVSGSFLLRIENVSGRSCRENQNTPSVFNKFFFPRKSYRVYDNVKKKSCTAGQATDNNMAHARCMLETKGYIHTLRICNIYCFAAAKMVWRKCRSVRLIGELMSHYCLALSQWRFANAPLSFVIFFSPYAHNSSITTERIVITFHNIGGFYKDSCGRTSISILVKIGRNDSRKLHAVLLAFLT